MCETIATTNSNGYFEFSQDCLSFGVIVPPGMDEFGQPSGTITIENKLMLFADDGQNYGLTGLFEVDEYQGAEINIYLSNE